ncbi:hypothetical protein [Actinocatenispora rupis]|uniref:DUF1963 domain-containing protein n=1 Tax=Actinocatenispora rupis TaxID=519421 RepID=A0A8J3JDD3_9ACTN|nr:hypothetical protein [Actinocatenispora rupis]GID16360.1 hypothetical protein Aru02nite_72490 [Actinocatenispora rupis]
MTHTTGPPPYDLAAEVPGLAAYARTTVRLHPRRGRPDVRGSHLGGRLLWPSGEPWPTCARSRYCALEPGVRMLAVVQLTAADVGEIRFPPGTDLVQVLWCGSFHGEPDGDPESVRVYWRRAADVVRIARQPRPDPADHADESIPRPCVLDPERVTEYPWFEELPADVLRRLRAWRPSPALYPPEYDEVSAAPGYKVGGSMRWDGADMPTELVCTSCGAPAELLIQFDTAEWSETASGQPSRWWPVEDRDRTPDTATYVRVAEPTGVWYPRGGNCGVFVCSAVPGHPARLCHN